MFRTATSCGVSQLVRKLTRDPRRLIYTDSYLGLTSVHATQEEELMQLQGRQNLMNLKSRIISSADKGLLLSTDLDNISLMAIEKDDLSVYKDIIIRFIELNQDHKVSLLNAGTQINKFYQLCHLMNAADIAMDLFKDDHVRKVISMNNSIAGYSLLLLIDLLFKSNKFSHIIKVYEEMDLSHLEKSYEAPSIFHLFMLALIKMNQPEAFAQATMLMDTIMKVENPGEVGKGRYPYAWLACMEERYSAAYEIVHHEPTKGQKRSLQTNMKLFTLLKMDKPVDTTSVLEDIIKTSDEGPERPNQQKPTLCKEVIQLLVAAAKDCRDDKLLSRLKIVFSKLDNAAEITDKTVEDLLFLPVDGGAGSNQRKRETNLDDLRRRYKAKSE